MPFSRRLPCPRVVHDDVNALMTSYLQPATCKSGRAGGQFLFAPPVAAAERCSTEIRLILGAAVKCGRARLHRVHVQCSVFGASARRISESLRLPPPGAIRWLLVTLGHPATDPRMFSVDNSFSQLRSVLVLSPPIWGSDLEI